MDLPLRRIVGRRLVVDGKCIGVLCPELRRDERLHELDIFLMRKFLRERDFNFLIRAPIDARELVGGFPVVERILLRELRHIAGFLIDELFFHADAAVLALAADVVRVRHATANAAVTERTMIRRHAGKPPFVLDFDLPRSARLKHGVSRPAGARNS